jgi:uncharacterized protein YfiM (DUF2279 family)
MAIAYLKSIFPLSIVSFFFKKQESIPFPSRLGKLLCFVLFSVSCFSQSNINSFLKPSDTLNGSRKKAVYITEGAVLGATLIGLNQLWYKDYKKSKFHFINDNDEWLQMDKVGHMYSSYHLGRVGAEALQWSGASKKEQLIYGSTLGLGFLTVVEVFDGFSEEWGASSGDILANISGTALYVSQELLWNEQRITPKFSYHKTNFPSLRPNTLGETSLEQILKDYNGQNYWLSFNIHSFTKLEFVPKWLNLALGYGGSGMLFGTQKDALANGYIQNEYRQFYLSLDVDLTKIETKSHFLKTVFAIFNTIKIPAPTLQLNSNKDFRAYGFYF